MTDGWNNSGRVSPLTAAEVAQTLKVKVYTIGIGLRGMAPMPVAQDPVTGQVITRMTAADVDEETLQKIADMTGGKYYRADSADTMRRIYAEIDSLEKTEVEVKKFEHFDELYRPVGLAGLGLLLLEFMLSQTVWRKLP